MAGRPVRRLGDAFERVSFGVELAQRVRDCARRWQLTYPFRLKGREVEMLGLRKSGRIVDFGFAPVFTFVVHDGASLAKRGVGLVYKWGCVA